MASPGAGLIHAVAAALLLIGCSGGFADRTALARDALDRRDPEQALRFLNEELGVSRAEQLPPDPSGDAALLLLDRAMVLQSLGRLELSSRDLELADKQIELLDLSHGAADSLGRYLYSDEVGRYQAPAYEKLLINTLNLVNYLARGQLGGARVEARRLAVMQRFLARSEDPQAVFLGAGSYLAGFAFERSGRPEEALRWYDEALRHADYGSLDRAIVRLSARSSVRSPRLNEVLRRATGGARPAGARLLPWSPAPLQAKQWWAPDGASAAGDAAPSPAAPAAADPAAQLESSAPSSAALPSGQSPAELLVIFGYGRVPPKLAQRVPIGLALSYASGALSPADAARADALAAQGLVTWINYPELGRARGTWGVPRVSLDGRAAPIEGLLAVDSEAYATWEQARGAVMAGALTRLLTRVVLGEGVRHATGGGVEGLFASLITQASLAAADTPDTRSWSTLPARLALARLELPPGSYRLRLSVRGETLEQQVELAPGGWRALLLTALH